MSVIKKCADKNKDNVDADVQQGIGYALPTLFEKFDHRWDDQVHYGDINPQEFKKVLCLKEFCDKFNSHLTSSEKEGGTWLHLSSRKTQKIDSSFHYPIRLTPHLNEKNANPKSPKYWLYCKHLCLWLLPCKNIRDLLPNPELSEDELKIYWINKYQQSFGIDPSLLPKWARAYHNKYHRDEDSLSTSSDSNSEDESVPTPEESSEHDKSPSTDSEEDMDPDLRARRADNVFYQNPEDQLHFRQMEEIDPDPLNQVPGCLK